MKRLCELAPQYGLRRISPEIWVLPSSSDPLSADVGIVTGKERIYLYDVGSSEEGRALIHELNAEKTVILSHFHRDHIFNLPRIDYNVCYAGKETLRHTGSGELVEKPFILDDGVHIEIAPLPSSHAKGSLLMSVNEEYAFLGDGVYAGTGKYNTQLLKAEIDTLTALSCRYFLLSHNTRFVYEKQEVLEGLSAIYAKKEKGNPFIEV